MRASTTFLLVFALTTAAFTYPSVPVGAAAPIMVPSDGSTVTTDVAYGSYTISVSGTYKYSTQTDDYADASYSWGTKPSKACDNEPGNSHDLLVNDASPWTGLCDAVGHAYEAPFDCVQSSCTLRFRIYEVHDDWYYDNSGYLTVHIAPSGGPRACSDGVDNDGDGRVDYPDDPGCAARDDDTESPDPQCSDGLDNDGDGRVDLADAGCSDRYDDDESTQVPACRDYVDNDGDGRTDFPRDFGCLGPTDDNETNGTPLCVVDDGFTTVCLATGELHDSYRLVAAEVPPAPPHHVAGRLDRYDFTTTAGTLFVPCVTLWVDDFATNACAAAGGRFRDTTAWLVDETVTPPGANMKEEGRLDVCRATVVVLVAGFGFEGAVGYAPC